MLGLSENFLTSCANSDESLLAIISMNTVDLASDPHVLPSFTPFCRQQSADECVPGSDDDKICVDSAESRMVAKNGKALGSFRMLCDISRLRPITKKQHRESSLPVRVLACPVLRPRGLRQGKPLCVGRHSDQRQQYNEESHDFLPFR